MEPQGEILRTVCEAGPGELAGIEVRVRRHWEWGILPLRPGELHAVSTELLGAASFHRNGRIREAAVRCLAERDEARAIPFLLLRLNDWVEPIRKRAFAAVRARLAPGNADVFLVCLAEMPFLDRRERADHGALLAEIHELIVRSPVLTSASRGIHGAAARRLAFRLWLARAGTDGIDTVAGALGDGDQRIRMLAVERVLSDAAFAALLPGLLDSPIPAVRRRALRVFAERGPAAAAERLGGALFDRSGGVRETARHYLAGLDFAGFYRRAVRIEPSVGALSGLGETGTEADAALVRPHLLNERSRIARAAVYALSRLDLRGSRADLVRAMRHPSRSVCRRALTVFRREIRPTAAEIETLLDAEAPDHSRLAGARLAERLDLWIALPILLRAGLGDALDGWIHEYRHGIYAPRRPEPHELSAAREALSALPPGEQRTAIEAILDSPG